MHRLHPTRWKCESFEIWKIEGNQKRTHTTSTILTPVRSTAGLVSEISRSVAISLSSLCKSTRWRVVHGWPNRACQSSTIVDLMSPVSASRIWNYELRSGISKAHRNTAQLAWREEQVCAHPSGSNTAATNEVKSPRG